MHLVRSSLRQWNILGIGVKSLLAWVLFRFLAANLELPSAVAIMD